MSSLAINWWGTPVAAPAAQGVRKSAGTMRSSRSEASRRRPSTGSAIARGTTDQQAGTFMHEFGHLLGFQHGGRRCRQQQAQLPERHELQPPVLRQPHHGPPAGLLAHEVDLNEASLNECSGIGDRSCPTRHSVPFRRSSPPRIRSPSARAHGRWSPHRLRRSALPARLARYPSTGTGKPARARSSRLQCEWGHQQ